VPSPSADQVERIKTLAEACSIQAKVSNRTWLGTIAVALLLLLPLQSTTPGCPPAATLPFVGVVAGSALYPVALAILSVLIIALAAAHAQHVRADQLSNHIIEAMETESASANLDPRPRDLFDVLRQPGLTRVAPLAQWLQRPRQWAARAATPGLTRRIISTGAYLILKLVALVVLFAVPGVALYFGWQRVVASDLAPALVISLSIASLIAGLSLITITVADFWGIGPRLRYIWSGQRPAA